jgi:hypothetical protein
MIEIEEIASYTTQGETKASITYSKSNLRELFNCDVMDALISTTEGGISQFDDSFISEQLGMKIQEVYR